MAQQGAELARSPSAGSVASAAPEGAAAHGVGDEVEVDGVDSISQTRAYSAASRPAKAAEGPTVPPSRRYDPRHCEKLYGEHTKRIEKRDQLVAEKRRESEMRHRTLVKDFKLDQALSKEKIEESVNRLYGSAKKREEKLSKLQEDAVRQQSAACTFQPQVILPSPSVVQKIASSGSVEKRCLQHGINGARRKDEKLKAKLREEEENLKKQSIHRHVETVHKFSFSDACQKCGWSEGGPDLSEFARAVRDNQGILYCSKGALVTLLQMLDGEGPAETGEDLAGRPGTADGVLGKDCARCAGAGCGLCAARLRVEDLVKAVFQRLDPHKKGRLGKEGLERFAGLLADRSKSVHERLFSQSEMLARKLKKMREVAEQADAQRDMHGKVEKMNTEEAQSRALKRSENLYKDHQKRAEWLARRRQSAARTVQQKLGGPAAPMSSELQSKAVERLHRSAALRAEKRRLASKEKLAELEKQLHAESVHSAALSRLQQKSKAWTEEACQNLVARMHKGIPRKVRRAPSPCSASSEGNEAQVGSPRGTLFDLPRASSWQAARKSRCSMSLSRLSTSAASGRQSVAAQFQQLHVAGVRDQLRHALHHGNKVIRGRRINDPESFFDALDRDKRFALDRSTILQGIMLLDLSFGKKEINAFVHALNSTVTGLVERSEFIDLLEDMSTCASDREDPALDAAHASSQQAGPKKKPFIPSGRHIVPSPRTLPRVQSAPGPLRAGRPLSPSSVAPALQSSQSQKGRLTLLEEQIAALRRGRPLDRTITSLEQEAMELSSQRAVAQDDKAERRGLASLLFESLAGGKATLEHDELRRVQQLRGVEGELPADADGIDLAAFQGLLDSPDSALYCSDDGLESLLVSVGPRSWLVPLVFRLLARGCKTLDAHGALREYAELCGFSGSDDDWNGQLEEMSSHYGWDSSTGVDLALFERMLNDPEGHAWQDDDGLREICQELRPHEGEEEDDGEDEGAEEEESEGDGEGEEEEEEGEEEAGEAEEDEEEGSDEEEEAATASA